VIISREPVVRGVQWETNQELVVTGIDNNAVSAACTANSADQSRIERVKLTKRSMPRACSRLEQTKN